MRPISSVVRQLATKDGTDLIGAVAAGLCAGLARSGMNALNHDPSLWAIARWTIIAVAAYLGVAKLLQLFGVFQKLILPRWVLTAFLGSLVYVVALLAPSVIEGWYDPYRGDASLKEYMLGELSNAKFAVMLFSLIALPILGAFHYYEQIRKVLKTWHSGSPPPHIID